MSFFTIKEYRVIRAEKMRLKSLNEQKRAKHSKLDHQIFINQNPHTPTVIRFHPFEPHLAVADKDSIRLDPAYNDVQCFNAY